MMRRVGLILCLGLVQAGLAWGGGPILVDTQGTGNAVVWENGQVRYDPESGTGAALGNLSNQEARDLLTELFGDWADITISDGDQEISTVSLVVTAGTGLGEIDESNIDDHFTYCPPSEVCPTSDFPFVVGSARSGEGPIIFDVNGNLTDLIQGEGASRDILGFAGPRVVRRVGDELFITESQAILNGRFIDCADGATFDDPCQSPEVSLESFKAAIFHEIGHFLGLDHTQVNISSLSAALNGDAAAEGEVTTMLPLFLGSFQRTPHFDDKVAISTLYPTSAFLTNFCTITGIVFHSDGTTPLQGVNVIARRSTRPQLEATSFVSGALYTGTADCTAEVGDFQLRGIRPGARYTLEIEAISPGFVGGSSIEPCNPPLSGFSAAQAVGTFSCSSGGETITTGSDESTDFVSTKEATNGGGDLPPPNPGGGCSLLPH